MFVILANSNKVRMLHRHIKTLLDHGVVCIYIWSWPNYSLCTCAVINTCACFWSETFFRGAENGSPIFKLLTTLRVHCFGTFSRVGTSCVLVEPRSRNLKFEALSIKDLIIVEARWCSVKTDMLACHWFVIAGSSTMLLPYISVVLDACHLIFNAKDSLFVIHVLALFALSDDLGSLATHGLKDADSRWFGRVAHVEAISGWSEDRIHHTSFLGESCLHTGLWMALIAAFSRDDQVNRGLGNMRLDVIRTGTRVLILDIKPTILLSCSVWSEDTNLDTLRLSEGAIFANLSQAFADGGVIRVVNIDICTRSRIGSLDHLIAVAFLLLLKRNLHGLFLKETTLNVLPLLFVDWVLAGTWVA